MYPDVETKVTLMDVIRVMGMLFAYSLNYFWWDCLCKIWEPSKWSGYTLITTKGKDNKVVLVSHPFPPKKPKKKCPSHAHTFAVQLIIYHHPLILICI